MKLNYITNNFEETKKLHSGQSDYRLKFLKAINAAREFPVIKTRQLQIKLGRFCAALPFISLTGYNS